MKLAFAVLVAVASTTITGVALAAGPQPCSSGSGMEATGPCKKAKSAAAAKAREQYGFDQPARRWSTACYPESARRFECTVHSGGAPPRCTGGLRVIKRSGRWRARRVELLCSSR